MKTSTMAARIPVLVLALVCACACALLAGCGNTQIPSSGSALSSSAASVDDNRQMALDFAEAWYGDWSFDDEMQLASSTAAGRCVGYVDPASALYTEMEPMAASRDAARCATQINVKNAEGDSVVLEVEYVSTQSTGIDEPMFNELKKHSTTDTLIFKFNSQGKITAIDGLN